MSNQSGMNQSQSQTQTQESWSRKDSDGLMMLLALPLQIRLAFWLLLLLLVVSLTACGTVSTPPTTTPRNPEMPPSVLPDSPPNYLESARESISTWRNKLTELMATPAN